VFKFEDNKIYHMPPFFGGIEFRPDIEGRVNDVVNINFTQTTDRDRLADYLPEGFELLRPELNISYCQLREVEFMAGGSYNLVQIGVPARFKGKRDQLEGTFPLVIWENKTRPILGGREESGQPKIYADIEDLHIIKQKYFTNVSFEGNTFLRLEIVQPQLVEGQSFEQIKAGLLNYNMFGWRYIPKVGVPGAELSQPILYPQGMKVDSVWMGRGTVQWTKLNWEQNENQWEIIKALAELPVKAMSPVMMMKGAIIMKPFAGRVLE
jgi:Acetoacetate decarboxylase (ADC)